MTGGLPRFKKIGSTVGLSKGTTGFVGKFIDPLARIGADVLSDVTTPARVKIPPTPSPAPTPTLLDEDALQKERARRRQRINAAGRQGTILTGGSVLGSPAQTGSSLLGG